jgi:UDP-N-acetylmuramoylalanine-D-glutamate ligase
MELCGKKIVVMGLGVHGGGVGVARFCAEAGAR